MSVIIDDSDYRIVRNNDPSYQSMARISDTNNISDIYQEYIKIGNTRNDFATQITNFDNNKGILNDGKSINMTKFFVKSELYTEFGAQKVKNTTIPYFKFKTNFALNFNDTSKIKDTYVTKSVYEMQTDEDGTHVVNNTYSSYPLQRVDKLTINELPSLFIYINGVKIPDDEVYIYTNNSFTDVFIPEKYIPGNIHDEKSNINAKIQIDYRQPGSECLYVKYDKSVNLPYENNEYKLTIDLNNEEFKYNAVEIVKRLNKQDSLTIFKNGLFESINNYHFNVTEDNILEIYFNYNIFNNIENAELYLLNDIVYRFKPGISKIISSKNTISFSINDDFIVDTITGPISKNAISFFYNKKRILDSEITQTSRFSFEYTIDDNNYDISKIDFFIEDINKKIDENLHTMYGDDYYLLNMLGVKRCADKMLGKLSYSIFDELKYSIDFKEVLSKNGTLFDEEYVNMLYSYISDNIRTPAEKIKYLISKRPSLMRTFLERIKIPTKHFRVIGNKNNVVLTSVTEIEPDAEVFYKIYVNHILVETKDYTVVREDNRDIITVSKNVLKAVNDNNSPLYYGINEIELFQYDNTYKNSNIYKDTIPVKELELSEAGSSINGFTRLIDVDGNPVYRKTYSLSELNFGQEFVNDDICAIEQVRKSWYDSRNPEYYFYYPSEENIGYRLSKYFKVVERTDNYVTIDVELHETSPETTNGTFFLLAKQFNVSKEMVFGNADKSYMEENDLMFPIYNTYVEKSADGSVVNVYDYIPYITNSEPNIIINGREKIYGKDYTFINPERRDNVTTSYLVFKNQLEDNSIIVTQFNSSKTNVLLVGYDDLSIDNKYGLVYLSELPYPVSTEYMNIYINGEKLSNYDIDILSDKLVRIYHIYRPIRSILITTNLKYKDSEFADFKAVYEPSKFEKLLEEIFHNCDPSKNKDVDKPDIDTIYKINPYSSFVFGDVDYTTLSETILKKYEWYIKQIKENSELYNGDSEFIKYFEYDKDNPEAWNYAKKFFDAYKSNHGFEENVDSVKQKENPFTESPDVNYYTDLLEIMYLNWLSNSGKTRTYGFKANNIDPDVLKYFSVYENVIINDRIDIVVDSNRFYDGLKPDVTNDIFVRENDKLRVQYPGADYNIRRRIFFKILEEVFNNYDLTKPYYDSETGNDLLIKELCDNRASNILYPGDFPLHPDNDGIRWTGSDKNLIHGNTNLYKRYYIKFQIHEIDDDGNEVPDENCKWYKDTITLGYTDSKLYNDMYNEFVASHNYKNIMFISYEEYTNDSSLNVLDK